MKISIIIPCYNSEKHLRECIDSVISQTLREIEIICINDGSKDKTKDILREYKNADNRIKIFNETNMGAGLSRNLGIKNASGEFVCFMDSDDLYPEKDILETLYNAATTNNVLIAGGCFSFFENTSEFSESEYGYVFAENKIVDYSEYQFDYGFHRFIYSREFISKTGILFPNFERFQDPLFFVKIMSAAEKFYGLNKITYQYRLNEPSWNLEKCKGLVRGLTENLKFSSAHQYAKLHFLTLKRITEYFWKPITSCAILKDDEFAEQLCDLAASIDRELLKIGGFKAADVHILPFLCERIGLCSEEKDREILLLKDSWSYRVGHFVTAFPRTIRNILKGKN